MSLTINERTAEFESRAVDSVAAGMTGVGEPSDRFEKTF